MAVVLKTVKILKHFQQLGYKDNCRGWYDINNCGECNAYCRWVGNNGSGGDPSIKTKHGSSWWSCSTGDETYSKPGYFGEKFNFKKCCDKWKKSNSSVYKKDLGYKDNYRGWYDINNCGDHNVYFRWVSNGSGGNPSIKTQKGSSWWSCSIGDEPW